MIFDCETDNLLEEATKIHVLAYQDGDQVRYTHDYNQMRTILTEAKVLIGHNIVRFDIPVLERILGISIKAKLYDTLPMSWVMFTDMMQHGLEVHGERYGVPKPSVTDWQNLSPQEYAHRCVEDVKINIKLWDDLIKRFKLVYGNDKENMDRYLQYLTFKMKCAAMAEQSKWKLDIELVETSLNKIIKLQEEKVEELSAVMPPVPQYRKKQKPKTMFKKDRTLSAHGQEWFDECKKQGLDPSQDEPLKILKGYDKANPNSSDQVKDWLFSMGWEPCTFDYKKEEDGSERTVPQVRKDGELAPSVTLLIEEHPEVELLDGLTVLQHRRSIFEGLLESVDESGYVKAEIAGLTNTLRFKHKKPLVNLPGVDKPWGKEIRGSLIAREGHILCGADMVSLEATTKKHFIHPYDPAYVYEMSQPGFDEHLDLAVKSGYISQDDYNFYTQSDEDTVNDKDRFKNIKKVRKKFKPVNYASVYGVGAKKLSRTTGMSVQEAGQLIDSYWDRNWAVKQFASEQEVKTVGGQMWVKNPVNNFWYTLRFEKDIFSTLNQGTGAYCFDQWVAHYLTKRPNIIGQFHDESINDVPVGEEQEHEAALKWAIQKVNEKLKLNVDLDVSVQFGNRYSDIH